MAFHERNDEFDDLKAELGKHYKDIAKLLKLQNAVDLVSQYMKDHGIPNTNTQMLSPYRKRLFKALKEVREDTLDEIISCYKLRNVADNLPNIWAVVYYLERELRLEDEKKIKRFAKLLPEKARNLLLDNGAEIKLKIKFNQEEVDGDLVVEVNKYCKDMFTKLSEHFKNVNPSLSLSNLITAVNPNTSLVFSLASDSRSALSKLKDIQLNGQLIKNLAQIFVIESQQNFVENWETIINEELQGVQLLLMKNLSSIDDKERPHALEVFFTNMEKQNKAVIGRHCDSIMKTLTTYFKSIHLYFTHVGTGSLVLYLTAYDSEALENLWEAYCNKTLQRDLAKIVAEEFQQEFQHQLLGVKIEEQDLKSAMTKIKEIDKVGISEEFKRSLSPQLGLRDYIFTYIKAEFSRWYDKKDLLSLLKTLYKDLLLPHMLEKASSTRDLLEFLIESNHLTSKDLTLFFDTINATGEFELVRKIQEEVVTFPNVEEISVSKFSRHRCVLVEFGNKLTTKNVESISDLVNEAPTSYEDKWCLINDLENRQIISEGKMQLFIEKLGILKLGEPEEGLSKCEEEDPFKAKRSDDSKKPRKSRKNESEDQVKAKKPRKSKKSKTDNKSCEEEDPFKAKRSDDSKKPRKNESEDQVKAKKPRKSKKKTTLRDYVREMFVEKKCSVKTDSETSPKEMKLFKGIDDSEPSTLHQQLLSQDTMTDEHAVDEICNSVRRFCTYMRRGKSFKTDQGIIKMINSLNEDEKWKHRYRWEWIRQEPSKDIGRMLAHVLIAVKDEGIVLLKISQSCTDDVVKCLSTECSKYTFKYNIEAFQHRKNMYYAIDTGLLLSTSFLIHLLINAPRLKMLQLRKLTGVTLNDTVDALSKKGVVLELENLDIHENTLNDITDSSLGTLLAICPKLKTLNISYCRLSGVTIDAMVRECVNRNLVLELDNLDIHGNFLNYITGSSLGTLLAISPKLKTLNMYRCDLSGVIIGAMVRECVNRNLVLELDSLYIHENTLSDITGSVLGTLLAICPKLKTLNISYCNLSVVTIDAMVRECVNRNLMLELNSLDIRENNFNDITDSSLGTLLAISPKLKTPNIYSRTAGCRELS
ncbi:uncharacterized protein [Antedon mediterranea]|uniref:uncharacterized protein n=1 Tax=Antedon mediterranea TaxID=105859 RepID=UPI003AF47575